MSVRGFFAGLGVGLAAGGYVLHLAMKAAEVQTRVLDMLMRARVPDSTSAPQTFTGVELP